MYEVFEHTADIGLRVRASTPEELFAEAGRGFFALIVDNLDEVAATETVQLRIQGRVEELDYLLFDWLNELLYLFDSRQLLLRDFKVRLTESGLDATVCGEPFDAGKHRLEHELKAITYHGLKVQKTAAGWLAEVVLDI